MKQILTNLHNFIHDVAIKVDLWIKDNPTKALWIAIFLGGFILGAILF